MHLYPVPCSQTDTRQDARDKLKPVRPAAAVSQRLHSVQLDGSRVTMTLHLYPVPCSQAGSRVTSSGTDREAGLGL